METHCIEQEQPNSLNSCVPARQDRQKELHSIAVVYLCGDGESEHHTVIDGVMLLPSSAKSTPTELVSLQYQTPFDRGRID